MRMLSTSPGRVSASIASVPAVRASASASARTRSISRLRLARRLTSRLTTAANGLYVVYNDTEGFDGYGPVNRAFIIKYSHLFDVLN